jgi:hypothetical protein
VAVCSCSVVELLAREMTSSRREGGKAPRPTRTRSILKASQSVLEIAVSPESGGVAIAGELGGDLEVGGVVLVSGPEDQSAAKDQGLRCGTSPHQGFEPSPVRFGEVDALGDRSRHDRDPWYWGRVAISCPREKGSHKSPGLSRVTKSGAGLTKRTSRANSYRLYGQDRLDFWS